MSNRPFQNQAVAGTHRLAVDTAESVLRDGGNAFDAAVAAAFVLYVVEPHHNGPGGEVAGLLHVASERRTYALSGQGPVPMAVSAETYTSVGLDHVPASGFLAATVPGAVAAWLTVLRDWGTWPVGDVLAPAISHAMGGVPLHSRASDILSGLGEFFRTYWPTSAATYLDPNPHCAPGSVFRNPQLGLTFRAMAEPARKARLSRIDGIEAALRHFYQGPVAEGIDRFVREPHLDASGQHNQGLLRAEDLSRFSPSIDLGVSIEVDGLNVHKPGPWSQGPVFLQQLRILEAAGVSETQLGSTDYAHLVLESARLAMTDRDAWYGDPDFVAVPLEVLLSREYGKARAELISRDHVIDHPQPGRIAGHLPQDRPSWRTPSPSPGVPTHLGSGLPTMLKMTEARDDTCTIVVGDRWGNCIAATPSGGWMKSSPVVEELGFPLGTRAQTMPLGSGFANSIAPGKRPRTTLSPTMVTSDRGVEMAFGTPGGDRQDQWTLQLFLATQHGRMALDEALEQPLFHTDDLVCSFVPHEQVDRSAVFEEDFDPTVLRELASKGYDVSVVPARSISRTCAIQANESSSYIAAATSRGGETAALTF